MEIKEIPMLFSEPMVLAAMDETKTMTRRTRGLEEINVFPNRWKYKGREGLIHKIIAPNKGYSQVIYIKCPYGKVGDIIWIRETFEKCKKGFRYRAGNVSSIAITGKWKPSIHMPKIATRTWLKIVDIRLERLGDISQDDAMKEGILVLQYDTKGYLFKDYLKRMIGFTSAVDSFKSLWISINGEKSWRSNPWVWVIEFKKK